ncbi:hypothetical protein Tco_1109428 [Tanacetum coccineum]
MLLLLTQLFNSAAAHCNSKWSTVLIPNVNLLLLAIPLLLPLLMLQAMFLKMFSTLLLLKMAMLSVQSIDLKRRLVEIIKFNTKMLPVKKVDSKTRYSQFKIKELDKSEEPKALVSVDSMLSGICCYPAVDGVLDGVVLMVFLLMRVLLCCDATDAETQFALMGLSPQAKIDKMNNQVKLEESNARFDKWKESSKNLVKLINSSMNNLLCWFVKPVGMHVVPPPITGTFMPPSNKPDIDDTQFTYGLKSNNYSESNSVSNKSFVLVKLVTVLRLETTWTTGFASCASSVNSSSTMANASSLVDLQTLHKTDDQGPCNVTQSPSFSFKENVKTPRNFCNRNGSNKISLCNNKSFGSKKCFVCGSKFHLIRDCDFYENQLRLNNAPVWKNVENIPSFVPRPAYVPAGSRNRPTSIPAGRPFPTGSRNRPTSVPAGRPFPAGEVREMLLRPQQVVLDKVTGHISIGDPRTMDNPHTKKDLGIVDSGCSRSMTGNKEKLADFVKIKGGTVTFGGGDGQITGKGTIRTSNFNF